MTAESWEVVAAYSAMYEAELAAGRLDSERIPNRIDQRGAVGLFGPGHGGKSVRGIAVLVPASRLNDARAALDLEDEAED